jgi:hypothetical protein
MAEIIHIRELQQARERERRRAQGHQSLDQAVAVLRENLAAAAVQLRDAPAPMQPELLERVERLAALVRYGMRMVEADAPDQISSAEE